MFIEIHILSNILKLIFYICVVCWSLSYFPIISPREMKNINLKNSKIYQTITAFSSIVVAFLTLKSLSCIVILPAVAILLIYITISNVASFTKENSIVENFFTTKPKKARELNIESIKDIEYIIKHHKKNKNAQIAVIKSKIKNNPFWAKQPFFKMEPRHNFLNKLLTICLDESITLDQESIQVAYESIFDNLYNLKESKKTGDKEYEIYKNLKSDSQKITRDDLKQLIITTNKGYQAKAEKRSRVPDESRNEQCIRVKTKY